MPLYAFTLPVSKEGGMSTSVRASARTSVTTTSSPASSGSQKQESVCDASSTCRGPEQSTDSSLRPESGDVSLRRFLDPGLSASVMLNEALPPDALFFYFGVKGEWV